MAIGKQSLNRVANGGVQADVTPSPVTESSEPIKPKTASAPKQKPAPLGVGRVQKTYAVGDKLPEYLL